MSRLPNQTQYDTLPPPPQLTISMVPACILKDVVLLIGICKATSGQSLIYPHCLIKTLSTTKPQPIGLNQIVWTLYKDCNTTYRCLYFVAVLFEPLDQFTWCDLCRQERGNGRMSRSYVYNIYRINHRPYMRSISLVLVEINVIIHGLNRLVSIILCLNHLATARRSQPHGQPCGIA
jgi:hypothetical protein